MHSLIGQTFTKLPGGRQAQVTAIYKHEGTTRAVMYWPDINAQTTVNAARLTPHHHWHRTDKP